MSDQPVCYDCERDFAAVCRKCSDDKVAALRAQLAAVEKERDAAKAESEELNQIFDLQQTRMRAATSMWQEHHGKPHVLPDLGELLEWLMAEGLGAVVAREAALARVKALEAVLEPTAENVRAYEMAGFGGDTIPQDLEIQGRIYARNARKVEYVLAAIRARAGLTEEGT